MVEVHLSFPVQKAEVVIGVLDGCVPLEEIKTACNAIRSNVSTNQKLILLRNKVDAYDAIAPQEFPSVDRSYGILPMKYPAFGTYNIDPETLAHMLDVPSVIDISAKTGEGLDRLKKCLVGFYDSSDLESNGTLVTNLRHYEALSRAWKDLSAVRSGLDSGLTPDLLAEDLRSAIRELGSIFGEIAPDEVLGSIFGRFCIGK